MALQEGKDHRSNDDKGEHEADGVYKAKRMGLPNRQGMTYSASSDMKISVRVGCLGRTHSAALSTEPLKSSRTMTRTRNQQATDAAAEATMDGMRGVSSTDIALGT